MFSICTNATHNHKRTCILHFELDLDSTSGIKYLYADNFDVPTNKYLNWPVYVNDPFPLHNFVAVFDNWPVYMNDFFHFHNFVAVDDNWPVYVAVNDFFDLNWHFYIYIFVAVNDFFDLHQRSSQSQKHFELDIDAF